MQQRHAHASAAQLPADGRKQLRTLQATWKALAPGPHLYLPPPKARPGTPPTPTTAACAAVLPPRCMPSLPGAETGQLGGRAVRASCIEGEACIRQLKDTSVATHARPAAGAGLVQGRCGKGQGRCREGPARSGGREAPAGAPSIACLTCWGCRRWVRRGTAVRPGGLHRVRWPPHRPAQAQKQQRAAAGYDCDVFHADMALSHITLCEALLEQGGQKESAGRHCVWQRTSSRPTCCTQMPGPPPPVPPGSTPSEAAMRTSMLCGQRVRADRLGGVIER